MARERAAVLPMVGEVAWEAEVHAVQARLGTGWEAPVLLLLTVMLLSFGLVTLYSASAVLAQSMELPDYHFVVRQALGGAVGMVGVVLLARIDYRHLRRLAWPTLMLMIAMLVVQVLPGTQAISPTVNGARRWLEIGPVWIQPSEFAKLALLVWTAALCVKKQDQLPSLSRGLLPFLIVWSVVAGLVFLQPNLSTALLMLLLCGTVVFAGGGRIGHFLLLGVFGLPLVWSQVESVAYRLRRIVAFVDPTHDPAGASYQIDQALVALGSGGVLGLGFGRGQQKFGFLPEPHNDFIFAMVGEEWGLVGITALVAAFVAVALVGYRIARQAPDLFGYLLAVGMTNLIVVQALLHMSVNVALVPTTGMALPFLSYGRSNLLVSLAAVGILMAIARVSIAPEEAE
ncbi:MAG TPA: putative lipid II flippase FtsW [Longimicrobiales bacterium]|nr:putative lipid II flippase FtsW [Longimicrobiales bacterium]